MEEVVKALLEQNAKLTEQVVELARLVVEGHSAQPAPFIPDLPPMKYPLNTPESEEDARALYAAGAIDQTQLEEALKELDFLNSDIVFPKL